MFFINCPIFLVILICKFSTDTFITLIPILTYITHDDLFQNDDESYLPNNYFID